MLALLTLLPRSLVTGSLIFLLGFACGQETAYRVLVHSPRVQKEQRLAQGKARAAPASAAARTSTP